MSVIDETEFKYTKRSLEALQGVLDPDDFIFSKKFIDYEDDINEAENMGYFYEMMENIRFLDPSSPSVAHTDRNAMIFLNCPTGPQKQNLIGRDNRTWDFIFCHECLHQLWDTFDVGEKIRNKGIEYNHNILNVASDCVINEFLKRTLKKKPFEAGIFKEKLEEIGVQYDHKVDTQFTLYLKLLKAAQKSEDNKEKLNKLGLDDNDDNDDNDGTSSGNSSNNLPIHKFSDMTEEYRRGWEQAVKDYQDGKIKF